MDGITRRKQWRKKGKRRINNEEEDKLKYAVAATSNKVYWEGKVKRKGKRKKQNPCTCPDEIENRI